MHIEGDWAFLRQNFDFFASQAHAVESQIEQEEKWASLWAT